MFSRVAELVETAREYFGYARFGTAEKIVELVHKTVLESQTTTTICQKKGWLTPIKALDLTLEYGKQQLSTFLADALETKTRYVTYQSLADSQKERFRQSVADSLATVLINSASEGKAVSTEAPSYLHGKPLISATITLTPLQKDEVEEAVLTAAKHAGILQPENYTVCRK